MTRRIHVEKKNGGRRVFDRSYLVAGAYGEEADGEEVSVIWEMNPLLGKTRPPNIIILGEDVEQVFLRLGGFQEDFVALMSPSGKRVFFRARDFISCEEFEKDGETLVSVSFLPGCAEAASPWKVVVSETVEEIISQLDSMEGRPSALQPIYPQ